MDEHTTHTHINMWMYILHTHIHTHANMDVHTTHTHSHTNIWMYILHTHSIGDGCIVNIHNCMYGYVLNVEAGRQVCQSVFYYRMCLGGGRGVQRCTSEINASSELINRWSILI